MAVWLQEITVENLGPLAGRNFDLDRLNLVYGLNETGKTFLVEFMIQSLFRHAANWNLREISGRGKVTVSGLGGGKIDFTPDSHRKLEDFWHEDDRGLPANMARLLVVKGGKPELSTGAAGGVGRSVLKTALSRETLLEQILSPIQQTIQEATIEGERIIADRRGKIKDREELEDELTELEGLLDTVERHYSGGPIRTLEIQLENIESSLTEQHKARRYQAYQLNKELQDCRQKRSALPDRKLETLRDLLHDHKSLSQDITNKKEKIENLEDASPHYSWLKNARETWQAQDLDRPGRPKTLFAILGIILSVGGLIAGLLRFSTLAFVSSSLGLLVLSYYMWRFRGWSQSVGASLERKNIRKAFHERFGEELRGLAEIKTRLENMQEAHIQAEQLKEDLAEREQNQKQLAGKIHSRFEDLTEDEISAGDWQDTLDSLREEVKTTDKRIKELEIELGTLGVERDGFRPQPASVSFDQEALKALEEKAQIFDNQLQEAQEELNRLKHGICSATGDEIDTPWNILLDHLRNQYEMKLEEYKSLTAEILAKIGVTKTLEQVREEEDEKIRLGLRSKEVINILQSVTEDYLSLDLEGEQVLVESEYGNYRLQDLSTGAKEQVQLALRMGFASRLAGGEPLFIILDDAFQHSDWPRRERLVKSVVKLARQDWQILYLTMDDHLRDLFHEAGKRIFSGEFVYHELD